MATLDGAQTPDAESEPLSSPGSKAKSRLHLSLCDRHEHTAINVGVRERCTDITETQLVEEIAYSLDAPLFRRDEFPEKSGDAHFRCRY